MTKVPNEKAKECRMEQIRRLTKEAAEYLIKNEDNYKRILGDIVQTLELIVCEKGWTIHGRVKSDKSLREKILRKGYYNSYKDGASIINNLPDLIGVRVQCLLNQEEKSAYELLQNKKETSDKEGHSAYQTVNGSRMTLLLRNQPEKQKNGHDIYRIEGRYYAAGKTAPVHFELQIKSMVHSFWGELEHSMFYKNYDYFISQRILTQSMDNILAELDLIDKEMVGIQNNFSRSKTDRINEFKSVCISIIQKEYQNKFNALYECDMDLRAAYWLIVEIRFNNIIHEENAAQELSKMIQQCKNIDISDTRDMIEDQLDADSVSPDKKRCVEWLDQLVKGNSYWEAFFCIYTTLNQDGDFEYRDWLEAIAKRLLRLKILNIFAADFSDNHFSQSLRHALIFGSNGKLEYFMDERNLHLIQEKISEALKGSIFEKYEQGCVQENFDRECVLESVFLWAESLICFRMNGYIRRKSVEELKECLNKENIFPVDIEGERILECFGREDKLSGEKAKEIYKRLFVWEEKVE
ncbi:MAG: hypothetical protein K2P48_05475 [Lachnospiraceae bacterium]|nr:hypothetical protein [Lachnospiraceae bacterium]